MSSEPEPNLSDYDQFVRIVSRLEDLVKLASAAERSEVQVNVTSFVEVHKKLMDVYKMIQQYRENYTNMLAALGLTPEDVRMTPDQIEKLAPRERKVVERLERLQKTCEDAKERIHESLQQNKEVAKQVQEELKEAEGKKAPRKDKFKGMGGKKGWLPT